MKISEAMEGEIWTIAASAKESARRKTGTTSRLAELI
jgi:hypothetical protein